MSVLLLIFAGFSVLLGYVLPYRAVLQWPMFTSHSCVVAELERIDGSDSVKVNPYDFVVSHTLALSKRDFDLFLAWACLQNWNLGGTVTHYGLNKVQLYRVRNTHVVD